MEAGRRLGGAAEILRRTPLTGGYASAGVERVDLGVDGREVAVVVKPSAPVEVAAMRAVAVVDPALVTVPRMLVTDPLVLTHVDGLPAAEGDPVPDAVWRTLAAVHRHWFRKRPRGVPVVDAAWWRALCARTLVPLRGGLARTGDPVYADAADQVAAWAEDPRMVAALAVLPRTLCHGDPHRGNILGGPALPGGPGTQGPTTWTLIDWGNARVAPAGLDLAILQAQGATDPGPYHAVFPELPDDLAAVEREWAQVQVHVQYLGFAADHQGAERVAEMTATAAAALARLGPALGVG